MIVDKMELNGYVGIIEYCENIFYAKSRSYKLIVTKNEKTYRNCFGFTLNGAKTEFKRWVNKQKN